MTDDLSIRIATPDDAEALLTIYTPYVQKTAISFEYDPPSLCEFRGRIERTLTMYPYLVAVCEGEIAGYAYTGAFHARSAYRWGAEATVYVKETCKGRGVGKKLYQALEEISRAQHINHLYACIAYPDADDEYLTQNSVHFHAHMGYAMVGAFHQCGYKFGRWYHMVWMEKAIGACVPEPHPVVPFPEIKPLLFSLAKDKKP